MLTAMPPVTFPDNHGQITYVLDGPNASGELNCTMGFGESDELTTAELQTLADSWETNVMPLLAANYTLVEVRSLQQDGANQIAKSVPSGISGSGSDPMSINAAVIVAKLTGLSGRKNRGRMFVPGIREGEMDAGGNVLSPGNLTFWQDAFDQVLADFTTAERSAVVHHRATSTDTSITELVVRPKLGTQRTRLRD